MDIEQVFDAIRGERAYQQAELLGEVIDERPIDMWLQAIGYQLEFAKRIRGSALTTDHDTILTLRLIAYQCVAAMQQYGVQPREGYGVQRYSHRNGETTPPEVEGWYWVLTYDDKAAEECYDGYTYATDYAKQWEVWPHHALDEESLGENGIGIWAIYGPIPAPVQEADNE